ncbi:unnamed protein product [Rotaria sordida]|uniref:OCEL domain-containing protein n=1 Tax=Rotaria sordida TaxID=392033 RepID=A0A819R228_9BILA|nr:unnamed protein product [Rotaria sordida]
MDRNLPGNHKFWLNEDGSSSNDGKIFIFVKLTDSCMKTIETFIKLNKKQNSTNKGNIKFNLNGGDISIPTTNGERKTYSFNISPEDKTPEVFQSIKQINRDHLESCAIIEQKLNIHAQEDVYSMTKTKVTEFQKNEEQTKKQTKEIGESSQIILQKKTNKSSNQRSLTTTTTTGNNPKQQRRTINREQHLSPNTNINTQSLSSERPLRERLVHLLAARTYKKPDLLLRLKHDSLLSSISTLSKSGEFIIFKYILTSGEVNYDWPFYPKGEASIVKKKIKELQANATRSTINKTTNDVPILSSVSDRSNIKNTSSNIGIVNSLCSTKSKLNSSLSNQTNRSTTNDERNQFEYEDSITSTQYTFNDQRIQQLSDMLDKISNALSQSDKSNDQLTNENDLIDEYDIDEYEKEYNRLVPEYNSLIDYLNSVSQKYSSFQQQFNEEQTNEKASKIVEEFLKCENNDGYLNKRQRLLELHIKLNNIQKIFEKTSPYSNHFDISEDDDDHHDH